MESENNKWKFQLTSTKFFSSFKIADLLIIFIAAVTVFLLIAAYTWKWPLIIQLSALFKFIKRLLVMIYAIIPVILLGHWISRKMFRFYPFLSKTWSLVIAWASGWAVIIFISLVLLAVGVYTILVWIVFSLIFNLTLLLWLFRSRWKPVKELWRNVLPELKEDILGKFSGSTGIWNIFIFLIVLLAFLLALIPPNSRDELAYHLVLPRLWDFQHDWWVNTDNYHFVFPANIEIIWGYALAIGGIHLPRLFTLLFGILTIGAFRRWLKQLQSNPWVCEISVLFFLMAPVVVLTLPICYVEWPMLFFVFLGWWSSRRYLETSEKGYVLLTAVTWGISAGTKYSAIPVIGLLAFEWLFQVLRRFSIKSAVRVSLVLLIGVLTFLGPWLARNLCLTNDPVFPLGQAPIHRQPALPGHDSLNIQQMTRYSSINGLWRLHPWVYHTTVETISDHRLHPGWILLHIAVILLGWKSRGQKPWVTVIILSVVFFYFTPAPRIYFPLMLLTWLFLPGFLETFSRRKWHRWIISALMVAWMIPSISLSFYDGFMTYGRASQDYLIGLINDEMMLRRDAIVTPVMVWVREKTPWDSRLWVWGDDRVFYFDRWVRPSSPYDFPEFLKILKSSGTRALTQSVKTDKIDFIAINTRNCSFTSKSIKTEKMSWIIPDALLEQLNSWIKQNLELILKDRKFTLYRVREKY